MKKLVFFVCFCLIMLCYVVAGAVFARADFDAPEGFDPEEMSKGIPVATLMDNPYMTLINRQNRLSEDWTDYFTFDVGRNALGEIFIVEHRALAAFEALRKDLLENEGIQIELDSVYRTHDDQVAIWNEWLETEGYDYCMTYLAPPDCSEHQTGLAIDVFLIRNGEVIRENDDLFAASEEFAKVHEYLWRYGFILRYLEGKEEITGYGYEPWHFRYLGDATIAEDIMTRGITFEEYSAEIPA